MLSNDARRFVKSAQPFWIAGVDSQWAFGFDKGVDDLSKTMERITDEAPVILLAHEPDIFPKVPERVSLTLSGHTHGGQIRIFGYSPIVPSKYGNRYAYGNIIENQKHMIVSGGLGTVGTNLSTVSKTLSRLLGPLGRQAFHPRLGVPPEIVIITVRK